MFIMTPTGLLTRLHTDETNAFLIKPRAANKMAAFFVFRQSNLNYEIILIPFFFVYLFTLLFIIKGNCLKTLLHFQLLTVIFLLVTSFMFSQTVYKIQNQEITSETHRNNIGKILWAKERIQFKNQDGISYISEFNQGDAIYGRGYLEDCLYNLSIDAGNNDCLNPNNEFELRLLVNSGSFGKLYENYFPDQDWTTFQVTLALSDGDREDRINKGITAKWATVVNKLAIGKYDITIEFWGGKPGCELIKYA